MEKKLKRFIHTYRSALLLGGIICIPVFLGLFLFVPREGSRDSQSSSAPTSDSILLNSLNGDGSVSCTFQGEAKGVAIVKKGKVKIEITSSQRQNILYVNEDVYIWEGTSASGKLIPLGKIPFAKSFLNQAEIKRQIDKYNPVCVSKDISDKLFIAPGNVKFEEYVPNLGEVMKM